MARPSFKSRRLFAKLATIAVVVPGVVVAATGVASAAPAMTPSCSCVSTLPTGWAGLPSGWQSLPTWSGPSVWGQSWGLGSWGSIGSWSKGSQQWGTLPTGWWVDGSGNIWGGGAKTSWGSLPAGWWVGAGGSIWGGLPSGWSWGGWGSITPPLPTCVGVPTLAALGQAGAFSEFSLGDATRGKASGSDSEGPVAYAGNASFNNFYVGTFATTPTSLVVGKNVSGTVTLLNNTKGVYSGSSTATSAATKGAAVTGLSHTFLPPVDFASTGALLKTDSAGYGAESSTPGTNVSIAGSLLTLTGTNAALNVFNLPAGAFGAAQTIFVHVPVGAITLINVPDTALPSTMYQDFQYWNGSAYESGGQYGSANEEAVQDATMLNFPSATSVTFGQAALAATVLAPKASFTFNSGQLDGAVYAGSIFGDFQTNQTRPFAGTCSCSGSFKH